MEERSTTLVSEEEQGKAWQPAIGNGDRREGPRRPATAQTDPENRRRESSQARRLTGGISFEWHVQNK